MNSELNGIISALLRRDATGQPLSTPDGVTDCSQVARVLGAITQDGRPFKSDEPSAVQNAIGRCIKAALEVSADIDVIDIINALCLMPVMIVRAVQEISPSICPEEVFMVAFDQCRIDNLTRDLAATPYFSSEQGGISTDVHSHPLLSTPFVIDDRVKHEFVRRHITPAHYAAHEDEWPESLELEVVDEADLTDGPPADEQSSGEVRKSGLGRLTACPLEGFDEFYEYFYAHDHKHWEAGLDIDDLPPFVDPNSREG